jgi:hypothetical protein
MDLEVLRTLVMIDFASSKYFVTVAQIVSPFLGSVLTAVASTAEMTLLLPH